MEAWRWEKRSHGHREEGRRGIPLTDRFCEGFRRPRAKTGRRVSCQVFQGLLSTYCMPGTGLGLYLDQGSPCTRVKNGFHIF